MFSFLFKQNDDRDDEPKPNEKNVVETDVLFGKYCFSIIIIVCQRRYVVITGGIYYYLGFDWYLMIDRDDE